MNARPQGQLPPQGRTGLASSVIHMFRALGYSLAGLAAGVRLSLSFRQEILVLVAIAVVLALTGKPAGTWLLCGGAWLAVMTAELINTALEEALNLITTDYSPQVKAAKDMASAAVFLLLVFNAAVWLHVFGPDLLAAWSPAF